MTSGSIAGRSAELLDADVHGGQGSCGAVTGASRFLIGLFTCFATPDGIPAVAYACQRANRYVVPSGDGKTGAGDASRKVFLPGVRRGYASRIFQKLSLRAMSPSESNVQMSQPRTSTMTPSTVVPVIVHSDTPRAPQAKWLSSL